MKLRIGLRLKFFTIFAAIGSFVSLVLYFPYSRYIENSYLDTLRQVTNLVYSRYGVLTAPQYIHDQGMAGSGEYWDINAYMDELVSTFDLAYIYYIRKAGDTFQFLMSSDDTPAMPVEELFIYYEPDEIEPGIFAAWETGTLQYSSKPNVTQWGTLVSVFMPIMLDGEVVAILGADYNIAHVQALNRQAFLNLGIALLASAFLGLLFAIRLTKPIKEVEGFSHALANANFDVDIKKFRKDELGDLQHSMVQTRDQIKGYLGEIQEERDTVRVMQNNLKAGIFLMDKDFVVQGNYSASLPAVLSVKNPAGQKFTDLISHSFTEADMKKVKDYFNMVLKKSISQRKLAAINPLDDLNYTSIETSEEKILRCGFASVDRGGGEAFILVTIDDITTERKLQKKLDQEERKRQEEMRAIFEVVHIDPRIFSDFMDDSQHNFQEVTNLLKDPSLDSRAVLIRIYQLVHAVKSDALIIGLEDFGNKLHGLEDEIKKLNSEEVIDLRKMLHLTVDIELILKEQDKLINVIERIRSQRGTEQGGQEKYVLVESLKQACRRTAADLNKKARLITDGIDEEVLKTLARRETKEVLVQLVRNAVYHGIESPRLRAASGKDEEGVIRLSIKNEGDAVQIELTDDGQGLDFDRIREKAEKMHIIKAGDRENKAALIKAIFVPRFSTADGSAGLYAGRGVGLSLVHDRVHEMKGTIKLRSEKGKGAAFIITIPKKQAAAAR